MARIFLTHPPEALANYYGDRAVAGLKALGEVRFNTAGARAHRPGADRGRARLRGHRLLPADAGLARALRGEPRPRRVLALRDRHPQRRRRGGERGGHPRHAGERGIHRFGERVGDRRDGRPRPPDHRVGRVVSRRGGAAGRDGPRAQGIDARHPRLRADLRVPRAARRRAGDESPRLRPVQEGRRSGARADGHAGAPPRVGLRRVPGGGERLDREARERRRRSPR